MTSELQIRANQRNAQRSTGPASESGKRKVALNGITHGLTAKPVVLHHEDTQAFEQMRLALFRAYKPVGDVEVLHADQAAVALWRLHRVLAVEGRLLLARQSAEDGEDAAQAFHREVELASRGLPGLSRYESGLQNSFHRSIEALREEQQERAKQEAWRKGDPFVKVRPLPSPGPWADVGSTAPSPLPGGSK